MRYPPLCPHSSCCEHHHTEKPEHTWWVRDGHFLSARKGLTQRYRCRSCGQRFSEVTFSLDYYSKKRVSLRRLRSLLTNGSSVRAAARQLRVSTSAISRRIMILARQSLAAHAELAESIVPREELVADGFQSFWVSQYHPNNFNFLAGADSQYLFAMTQATLRRSGSMTPRQKLKRSLIERSDPTDPSELSREFTRLLGSAEQLWSRAASFRRVLRTDKHERYPECLASLGTTGIRHIRVSSRLPRTPGNPLFAVNYLDREVRKDLAEHHRETVCFARSAVLSTARMWVYMVEHNCNKPYRIDPKSGLSHAEVAGVAPDLLRRVRLRMLTRRAFLTRTKLDHGQRMVWMGMLHTPERENRSNRRLTPAYSYA